MQSELMAFADIRAGYPFRGSVPDIKGGDVIAVQMRDIDAAHHVNWAGAVRTQLEGRKEPDWLGKGDILFASRGSHNIAVCLDEAPGPAVASQYFFLLRVRDPGKLLPEFLAWQINQPPAQRYLRKNAEGTDQVSIRRAVLEALPVVVLPLHDQQRLVDLARTAQKEREILERLIATRERQLQAVIEKLISTH